MLVTVGAAAALKCLGGEIQAKFKNDRQRQLSVAIKRARFLALMPYTDVH